jgi:hypothetical protein
MVSPNGSPKSFSDFKKSTTSTWNDDIVNVDDDDDDNTISELEVRMMMMMMMMMMRW